MAKTKAKKTVTELMNEGRRSAYYVDELDYVDGEGYRVVLVFENEPGYFRTDYRWGDKRDLKLARRCADRHNARCGIEKKEADKIVASSMFPKKGSK